MNIYKRKGCKSIGYRATYSGHEIDERDFHEEFVVSLIAKLFNKKTKIRIGTKTTILTELNSKAIVTFLNRAIGLPLGSKKDIRIPTMIRHSKERIKGSFLRGLADTDFSLSFKKRHRIFHYYPSINFVSESRSLVQSVGKLLKKYNIPFSIQFDAKRVRNETITTRSDINIYGKNNVERWMKLIGFNSPKHLTKYEIWKKYGFCPPNTTILERRNILKGVIDINSYYGAVA